MESLQKFDMFFLRSKQPGLAFLLCKWSFSHYEPYLKTLHDIGGIHMLICVAPKLNIREKMFINLHAIKRY